ncbi:MAG: hypothetical protein JJU42_00245 [Rhodobacteraceae bacterium]|nr:hypothetical protein [Paracoccaceae bacterium]
MSISSNFSPTGASRPSRLHEALRALAARWSGGSPDQTEKTCSARISSPHSADVSRELVESLFTRESALRAGLADDGISDALATVCHLECHVVCAGGGLAAHASWLSDRFRHVRCWTSVCSATNFVVAPRKPSPRFLLVDHDVVSARADVVSDLIQFRRHEPLTPVILASRWFRRHEFSRLRSAIADVSLALPVSGETMEQAIVQAVANCDRHH